MQDGVERVVTLKRGFLFGFGCAGLAARVVVAGRLWWPSFPGRSHLRIPLGHVLLRPEVGVVGRGVLVGVVLLAGQFGVVQAAGVTERSSAVRSTSPLGGFGAVAAVAAARWCGAASALLCVGTGEAHFALVHVMGAAWHGVLGVELLLLPLLGRLLFVCYLLGHYDFSNFREGLELHARFRHHVLDFYDAW